jgi:hypothetical protein
MFIATRLLPTRPTPLSSSSDAPIPAASQSQTEPTPKPRSRHCFVCSGTGTHRLSPKFCPQTWELHRAGLVTFTGNGHLVSLDGSPLPMTRDRSGVAAHLFASLACRRRLERAAFQSKQAPSDHRVNPHYQIPRIASAHLASRSSLQFHRRLFIHLLPFHRHMQSLCRTISAFHLPILN